MTNYKEILRLASLGISSRKISSSCGCSKTTALKVLAKARDVGLSWQEVSDLSDREVNSLLFPNGPVESGCKMPDYEYVHREMGKSGVTLTLLWLEYCEQCRQSGDIPYKSTQFNKYYRDHVTRTKATMHINRKPGELMEVDWAGSNAWLVDTDTGGRIPAYIFAAALPYSGYAYVEAFLSQDQESWISAHNNAYRFFGGVTRILVPDNLKTGVDKVSRSEVVINRAYQEMAEHYNTAVIPARIKAPRDKATVEGSIGIISTWILAALRKRRFLSLRELNEAIREKLTEFLQKPFQKKDGSRASWFAEEKPYLSPLPPRPYELTAWRVATVQYNYHIGVNGQNYSVPFEYIRRQVDVRVTKNMIEVLYEGHRICSHPRLEGPQGQYSTIEAHKQKTGEAYHAKATATTAAGIAWRI
jgi:transposase